MGKINLTPEMLTMVMEFTMNRYAARFIFLCGSEACYRHNEALMLYQRRRRIIRQLSSLENI